MTGSLRCNHCGIAFTAYPSKQRRYCSVACSAGVRKRRELVRCVACGGPMERRRFHVLRSRTAVFLHRACMPAHYRAHPPRRPPIAEECGHRASRQGVRRCSLCRSLPGTPRRTVTTDSVLAARADLVARGDAAPRAKAIHALAVEILGDGGGPTLATVYNVLKRGTARVGYGTCSNPSRASFGEHIRSGEDPCGPCRRAYNDYLSQWRSDPATRERRRVQKIARRRAAGVTPRPIAPCGGLSAHSRHVRHKDAIDEACRAARRAHDRRRARE